MDDINKEFINFKNINFISTIKTSHDMLTIAIA